MSIYAECSGMSLQQIADRYEGQMYGGFKKDLGEVLVATLEPLQQKYYEIRSSGTLGDILAEGAERARIVAAQNLLMLRNGWASSRYVKRPALSPLCVSVWL